MACEGVTYKLTDILEIHETIHWVAPNRWILKNNRNSKESVWFLNFCDASSRGAPLLHYSTIPVFKGDVPSEPPTAYKKPPSTATATPNLRVLMEATRVHLFSLGSYLKEEEWCHITTINRSGKHIWSTKRATCMNYLKNWRRYFTLRFGRVGLIPPTLSVCLNFLGQ